MITIQSLITFDTPLPFFQIQQHEETVVRESTQVKGLYEKELSDARNLLDELSTERSKFEIESGKHKADALEYKKKYVLISKQTPSGKRRAQFCAKRALV